MRQGRHLVLAVLSVVSLVAVACGGSDDDPDRANEPDEMVFQQGLIGEEPQGDPVDGGTLDFAVYSEVSSLDPASLPGFYGTAGGLEVTALYGVLMRYDPATGEYVPQLAKSLQHNGDYTTWTLRLRPGVEFSDGSTLDAQAVKFSIERYMRQENRLSGLMGRFVSGIATPNPRTVVFTLNQRWPGFPFVLANAPGCIVSPAAVEKWGKDFGQHPVGAGPFVLERFVPGEELVLKANPNYWGGRPHLDRLRFVPLQGSTIKLDALNSGDIDAALIRDPEVVQEARSQGYAGYLNLVNIGEYMGINNRDGHPGSDVRVRRAISYAIDPEIVYGRTYGQQSKELAGKELFQEFSRWHTQAQPLPYDPAKAKQLLAQAKADGYDGQIEITYTKGPNNESQALAVQALLERVGFNVSLDGSRTIQDFIRKVSVQRDYDLAISGKSISDATPYPRLYQMLVDRQASISGYRDESMATLVEEFRVAAGEEAKQKAMADIQQRWAKTVPGVPISALPEFVAWNTNVHGVVPTLRTVLLLQDAWMAPV